jgi:hypothetical protein
MIRWICNHKRFLFFYFLIANLEGNVGKILGRGERTDGQPEAQGLAGQPQGEDGQQLSSCL